MKTIQILVGGILMAGIPIVSAQAQVQARKPAVVQAHPGDSTVVAENADRMATRQTDMLKTELGLDSVQYKKLLDVNTKLMGERRDMWEAEAKVHQQNMDKLEQERSDAYKKVLTSDQLAKWDTMMQQMNARRDEHFHRGPMGRPGMGRPDAPDKPKEDTNK